MTRSPFSSPVFQQATFTFFVADVDRMTVDARGNKVSEGVPVEVTFRLRPTGQTSEKREDGTQQAIESYDATVISGDLRLPNEIGVEDVGEGEIRGRRCYATITGLSQSGVSPVTVPILGEKVQLSVVYRRRAGGYQDNS